MLWRVESFLVCADQWCPPLGWALSRGVYKCAHCSLNIHNLFSASEWDACLTSSRCTALGAPLWQPCPRGAESSYPRRSWHSCRAPLSRESWICPTAHRGLTGMCPWIGQSGRAIRRMPAAHASEQPTSRSGKTCDKRLASAPTVRACVESDAVRVAA